MNNLVGMAKPFGKCISQGDFSACIDYMRHVREAQMETICGVDLAGGMEAAKQNGDVEPLEEPWWPEGAVR